MAMRFAIVPHRGIPEALTDIMTGRVHFFMAPFASAITFVKEGRLRALGVTSPRRSRAVGAKGRHQARMTH